MAKSLFDSTGTLPLDQSLELIPLGDTDPRLRGMFRDPDDRLWLYVTHGPVETERPLILFAEPRSSALGAGIWRDSILRPLIQAAVIGLIISLILAIVLSRSVARPLQRITEAAGAIADGDYNQQAPEAGPREVQELAGAFNEMAQQVQRSQQTQRDLLANISHELKTPLTSIQGYAQAILDGAAAKPEPAARVIYDEAARMHRLVEELLDLARIESGAAVLQRDYVNLRELLDSVLGSLALRAKDQGVTLTYELDLIPTLTGDNDRLAQVFTNLVDNALTHTPAGGHIDVKSVRGKDGVTVSVQDTGKGIPPEDVERIFERFYQVDKSRARIARKSTGLGLTITKEIVEAHGGRIWAESSEGQGATFGVWLPFPQHSDQTVVRH